MFKQKQNYTSLISLFPEKFRLNSCLTFQSSGQDCAWIDRIVFPTGSVPPLNINFGDINLDGSVSIFDVILTVNYVIGYFDFSLEQSQNADMNLDGIVNIYDVLLIVDMALAE